MVGSAYLISFHALHAAPFILSMITDSLLSARSDDGKVGQEGIRSSYSLLPLHLAPEPGTVAAPVTVLGIRTSSQTRRAAALLQSRNMHLSGACLSPDSSHIDHSIGSEAYARLSVASLIARDTRRA